MVILSSTAAVGVDNMYLLVSAWWHSDSRLATVDRMTCTLHEAGASITLTSSASALSFLAGIFTDLNAVRLFCIYATVAITFNYLYQVDRVDSYHASDHILRRLHGHHGRVGNDGAIAAFALSCTSEVKENDA